MVEVLSWRVFGWAPEEPRFDVFALNRIASAALFFNLETERAVRRFRASSGIDEFRQTV